jgi:hypothetical protein
MALTAGEQLGPYEIQTPLQLSKIGNVKLRLSREIPLRIARYTEPFALLVGQLAYEGEGGPELAYRFECFAK